MKRSNYTENKNDVNFETRTFEENKSNAFQKIRSGSTSKMSVTSAITAKAKEFRDDQSMKSSKKLTSKGSNKF